MWLFVLNTDSENISLCLSDNGGENIMIEQSISQTQSDDMSNMNV